MLDTCQWCGYNGSLEQHHVIPKRMGGRHGKAKAESESPDNLVTLCRVCHAAVHGIRAILVDGHSCESCEIRCRYVRPRRDKHGQ
jgi:hypothetical protein